MDFISEPTLPVFILGNVNVHSRTTMLNRYNFLNNIFCHKNVNANVIEKIFGKGIGKITLCNKDLILGQYKNK